MPRLTYENFVNAFTSNGVARQLMAESFEFAEYMGDAVLNYFCVLL